LGQLLVYFEDCKITQDQVKKTTYSEKDLIKLFSKYTECDSKAYLSSPKASKSKLLFQPSIGATASTLGYTASFIHYFNHTENSTTLNPLITFQTSIYSPKRHYSRGFFTSLSLLRLKHSNLSEYQDLTREIVLTQSILRLKSGPSFNIITTIADIAINPGLLLGYSLSFDNQIVSTNSS